VSKVGLMILFLSRLNPLMSESPFFMLEVCEVVNSSAELSKCVSTRIEQVLEAPVQNNINQTLRFDKLDGSALS
jgi:hypothetical protein